jgi:hypothetical protein
MTDPTKRSLEDIAAEFDLSEAQAARGETVPLEQALRRLDATIARLEGKRPPF